MKIITNKNYILILAYLVLFASIIFDSHPIVGINAGIGYTVAVLLTLFTNKKIHTFIIGITGLSTMLFVLTKSYISGTESNAFVDLINNIVALLLAATIVLLNKNRIEKAAESMQRFEALFNHASVGIILCNHIGEIISFNKYAENKFGYTKEEIKGLPVETLIPKKFHSHHITLRKKFYAQPQTRIMGEGRDLHGSKKDGSEFPVEISLSNYEMNGKTFVIAFVVDITVRKKNETVVLQQKKALEKISAEIKQLNIELEQKIEDRTKMLKEILAELEKSKLELSEALEKEKELSDLKSRFVTMASHEFRTPLSTILSSAYLISQYNTKTDGQEKAEKHVQRIKGAVSGMKNILEDFLSLGKLEEGSISAKMEEMKLDDCIAEINNTIMDMQQIAKPGQKIEFSHNGKEIVDIDISLLKNTLLNLISNAIKFSPENSPIVVNYFATDNMVSISVKDVGIGISQEDQQHLFERFFRAKNASAIQGTGLGLHIVSKYLELMNGTIEIQSGLNKGSIFTINIPQKNIATNNQL